jgi:hypothetical protein
VASTPDWPPGIRKIERMTPIEPAPYPQPMAPPVSGGRDRDKYRSGSRSPLCPLGPMAPHHDRDINNSATDRQEIVDVEDAGSG